MPDEIVGVKVAKSIDYLTQTEFNLPKSNVLSFEMVDGSKIIIRPSGTEPLIKAYLSVCFDKKKNEHRLQVYKEYLAKLFTV